MIVLRIEHPVANFDAWKKVFDRDPADRKGGGVKSYKIFRPADDPNYVIIHLEFDELEKAKAFEQVLKKLWSNMQDMIITGPKSKIIEVVESGEVS